LIAKVKDSDDWAAGYTLGLMLVPNKGTRIGMTYRSSVTIDLDGRFEEPISPTVPFAVRLKMPQSINLGLYHEMTPRLALLGDVGWTNSSFFSRNSGSFGANRFVVNRNWKDTWRAGLGLQYKPRNRWLLRSGVSFNSSPISDNRRLPDLPVDDSWRFSLGLEHKLSDNLMIGVSYTFAYLGEGHVEHVQLPLQQLGPVVLDGDYSPNNAHFLGLTMRWHQIKYTHLNLESIFPNQANLVKTFERLLDLVNQP
jgi:long-chain fatty acid transport protein